MELSGEYSASSNMLTGTVVDASFTGVSTEYLVEVPGIGTISTFSQNLGQSPAQRGDTVRMTWEPEFSFGLDGSEETAEGQEAV